jgi:trimeric autotransporter adhesin
MPLNKQQLEAVNQNNFPDNNTQLITPALLRDFNTDIIDSIQLTGSYATTGSNTFVGNQTIAGNLSVTGVISASVLYVQTETASVIYSSGSNQFGDELTDVQTLSGSVRIQGQVFINGVPLTSGSATINTGSLVTTASFNAYTSSNNQRVSSLETNSASVNISITNVNSATASLFTSVNSLNQFTQSQSQLNGTFATTGSNTFTGNQIIDRASKLYTNGIYWTDPTAGFNNLEIINQSGGNLDLASLNGGKIRVVNTSLILTGSALTSSNDISTSANIYAANLTGSGILPSGLLSSSVTNFTNYSASVDSRINAITASGGIPTGTVSSSAQITALGFVSSSVTASSLITASVNLNTITFTKGDASTFNITVNTGSATTTDISSLNAFTASQETKNSTLANVTASLNANTASQQSQINSLIAATGSYALTSSIVPLTSLNAFTASQETKDITLASVTSSLNSATASLFASASLGLTTASFSGNTLTFRKGDNTTFGVVIPDVSGSGVPTGTVSSSAQIVELGFLQTSSFNSYTSSTNSSITQLNASSASQQISINALNAATSSYVTSAITASSLITASFSGNTLTFTKGNGTTFGVVIPDVSGSTINTGSFATTGSNAFFGTNSFSGAVSFTGSAPSILSQSFSGSLITNLTDVYTDVAAVQQIVTLTSASYAALASGSLTNPNTLYIVSGSTSGSGGTTDITALNAFTASQEILNTTFATTGSNTFTGTNTFEQQIDIKNGSAGLFYSNNNQILSAVGVRNTSGSFEIVKLGTASKVDLQNVSLLVSGTFTASLQEGYVWVGDASGKTVTVATSSFGGGGSIPAGTISGSQQITDLGFVSSSVTASSLVTASAAGSTITFTKGDASSFSVTVDTGSAGTTIYDTVHTGENITKGDPLYISGSQGANPIVYKADAADAAKMPVTYVAASTIAVNNNTEAIILGHIEGIDLTGYTAGQTIYVAEGGGWSTSLPSGSNSVTQLLGVVTKGGSGGKGLVLNPGPAQLPGLDSGKLWVGGANNQPIEISSASFATTGSNVFTGEQTLVDAAGNTVTLDDISGSLVLVSKGTTSGSAGLSHITAAANNQVNIIFKNNSQLSGSTVISGSNNILQSPPAPTAGFRRQASASNIMITGQIPEISSSVTFPVAISGNYANNIIRLRGPVSSSAWSFANNIVNGNFNVGNADATSANQAIAGGNMSNNILLAAVNYNAYTTPLVTTATFSNNLSVGNTNLTAFSSSITSQFNIFNGNTFTVNNRYFGTSSTAAAQRLALSYNVLGGVNTCTLTASGSNTTAGAPREVIANTSNGSNNQIGVVLNGDNSNLYSTLIYGNNLIVTGSSLFNTYANGGGAFIGRNNAVDGTKAYSSETIFAVGTGTGTGARKTGFLIDSGSNTFVDGTFNVTGPTSFNGAVNITGSLTSSLTEGYVWVGGAGNISTLVATSSFAGGVTSAITASSLITASVNLNTITFTKGDSSTFAITVDTGSGGGGTVPLGTVSSSAQILNYGIFATTGSNTFNGGQTIRSGGGLELAPTVGGGGSDNFINLASLNQSTLYIQNTSVSSGYQSGSVLQITESTGSNGFGGSGSAVFQMDAVYEGSRASMKVGTAVGAGSYVQGFANKIEFAGKEGSPNTPANRFIAEASSIELNGNIKVNTGTSASAATVNVLNGEMTVNNGLVNSNSIILLTPQELKLGSVQYATVHSKTNGSFTIKTSVGDSILVSYLIINPI